MDALLKKQTMWPIRDITAQEIQFKRVTNLNEVIERLPVDFRMDLDVTRSRSEWGQAATWLMLNTPNEDEFVACGFRNFGVSSELAEQAKRYIQHLIFAANYGVEDTFSQTRAVVAYVLSITLNEAPRLPAQSLWC